MNKWEYAQYCKNKHWKAKRLEALQRANNECQICGSQVDLSVHHKNYDNLWNEQPKDLIVACEVCHTKHHREESYVRRFNDIVPFIERMPTRSKGAL